MEGFSQPQPPFNHGQNSFQSPKKPGWWQTHWRQWNNRQRAIVIGLPVLIIIVVIGGAILASRAQPVGTADTVVHPDKPKPTTLPSLTNGVIVAADIANRHPVAVMIENSQAARPQVGLTSADIVYEAVTEGGITRFMAIFSQNYPDKAGPVRSARSYFIDYLSEYDAFYAHAGGSATALGRIQDYKIKDYPDATDAYHREPAPGVASEHTLFVDVSKIFNFGQSKRHWPATFDTPTWLFKDGADTSTATAKTISLNFSSAPFKVDWSFDPTKNLYSRNLAGQPHKDRITGTQITAKTIIVLRVNHSANPPYKTGKESEWNMYTIGGGDASVFIDGTRIDGKWKKPSRTERTRIYDANGQEVTLNRGQIWVEIVPQEGSVTQS